MFVDFSMSCDHRVRRGVGRKWRCVNCGRFVKLHEL